VRTQTSASQPPRPAKKAKHWVWIPAFTGSCLSGRWIEIDDNGSWAAEASFLNIVRVSGEQLQRTLHTVTIKRGQVNLGIGRRPVRSQPSALFYGPRRHIRETWDRERNRLSDDFTYTNSIQIACD